MHEGVHVKDYREEKDMSEWRRVVVTGLGAITPVGNNVSETWNSLKNGKNGIAPITFFDTEGFKAKLAAEVKGFEPKEYLEVNEILRTDRYAQLALYEERNNMYRYWLLHGARKGNILTRGIQCIKDSGLKYTLKLMMKKMIGHGN